MSEARFAEAAMRLAGLAGAVLGWRPDEFWRATPAELGTVLRVAAGEGAGVVGAAPVDSGLMARMQEAFPDG